MDSNKEFVSVFKVRIFSYSKRVIALVDLLPRTASAQVLAKQLLRSATSIGANFIEAQAANSRKDFINFLTIALKSSNESIYWFTLLKEVKKGTPREVDYLLQETIELSKILGSIVKKLRK